MEVALPESVEYSPIVLAFAQLVVLVLSGLIYGRQRSALDLEKRDRSVFGPIVSQAAADAAAAKRVAEEVETEHYRRLAALFAAQASEHEACKAKLRALEESVASLSNKLASREKIEQRAAKRAEAAAAAPAQDEAGAAAPGAEDMDTLLRTHGIPMGQPPPAPAGYQRPPAFGRRTA